MKYSDQIITESLIAVIGLYEICFSPGYSNGKDGRTKNNRPCL